jgi:hypothetical protein
MTTTIDTDAYLTETSATGKYFQVYVPSWGQDASSNNLSSFLRLGTTTDLPSSQWQSTLYQVFTGLGFFDDPRQRYDPGATNTAAQQTLPGVTGAEADGGLSVAQRQAETANLASKGGWTDHSDGNRITTTQGDKIEVVRGNYQLIVLGRQDSAGSGAIFDVSGGLIQPNDATPSNTMRLEWVRNYDGTWRIVEECQKGDVHNTIHGDVYEEQYGENITAITGSETQPVLCNPEVYSSDASAANGVYGPTAVITENNDLFDPQSPAYLGAPPATVTKKNPTIVEKTWAESISGYTGSSACRIPTIYEETWASSITELTDCSGTIKSTTNAGVVEEITTIGSVNEVTTVGSAVEVMVAGATVEVTTAGSKIDITLAGLHLEAALIPVHIGLEIGGKIDLFLGAKLEISGPEKAEFTIEEMKLVSAFQKAAAEELNLTNMKQSVTDLATRVTASETALANDVVHLNTTYQALGADISIGI